MAIISIWVVQIIQAPITHGLLIAPKAKAVDVVSVKGSASLISKIQRVKPMPRPLWWMVLQKWDSSVRNFKMEKLLSFIGKIFKNSNWNKSYIEYIRILLYDGLILFKADMKEKLRQLIFTHELSLKGYLHNSIKVNFFWSPVIAVLFVLAFNGVENFAYKFLISYSIALTCGLFCITGSYLMEAFYRWLNYKYQKPHPPKNIIRSVLLSYLFLIPGLYMGFKVAASVTTFLGHNSSTPDFRDYS